MKNIYTAYSKSMTGTTYYFVKKFITFPDLKNVPDVLENYGMHTDFGQACNIAKVDDKEIRQSLLRDIQENADSGRVIQMSTKIISAVQS